MKVIKVNVECLDPEFSSSFSDRRRVISSMILPGDCRDIFIGVNPGECTAFFVDGARTISVKNVPISSTVQLQMFLGEDAFWRLPVGFYNATGKAYSEVPGQLVKCTIYSETLVYCVYWRV